MREHRDSSSVKWLEYTTQFDVIRLSSANQPQDLEYEEKVRTERYSLAEQQWKDKIHKMKSKHDLLSTQLEDVRSKLLLDDEIMEFYFLR